MKTVPYGCQSEFFSLSFFIVMKSATGQHLVNLIDIHLCPELSGAVSHLPLGLVSQCRWSCWNTRLMFKPPNIIQTRDHVRPEASGISLVTVFKCQISVKQFSSGSSCVTSDRFQIGHRGCGRLTSVTSRGNWWIKVDQQVIFDVETFGRIGL